MWLWCDIKNAHLPFFHFISVLAVFVRVCTVSPLSKIAFTVNVVLFCTTQIDKIVDDMHKQDRQDQMEKDRKKKEAQQYIQNYLKEREAWKRELQERERKEMEQIEEYNRQQLKRLDEMAKQKEKVCVCVFACMLCVLCMYVCVLRRFVSTWMYCGVRIL